jgi:hypothetical protein
MLGGSSRNNALANADNAGQRNTFTPTEIFMTDETVSTCLLNSRCNGLLSESGHCGEWKHPLVSSGNRTTISQSSCPSHSHYTDRPIPFKIWNAVFILKKWNKWRQGFKYPKIVKFLLRIKTNSSRLSSCNVISCKAVQTVLCLHGRDEKYCKFSVFKRPVRYVYLQQNGDRFPT